MSDAAQDYWERRREELSICPKGADEIDTRFRRELEALAHQMAEFCHPYDDPLVSVAYAIARALDLPNWSAAHAEMDERDDAAIAAASVVKSLRLATGAAPMSAQPSDADLISAAGGDGGEEAASWQFSREELLHLLRSVLERWGAPAALPAEQDAAVLEFLDALQDDAAAHIFPSDLQRCMTSECCVEVASVRMGRPGERSVPLFSREQVSEALAAAKGRDAGGAA